MKREFLLREYSTYPKLYSKILYSNKDAQGEKYIFGKQMHQYYLHFAPKAETQRPLIVYIHGGGWRGGSPAIFSFIGQRLANMGHHVISLGYRLTPFFHYPAPIEDVFEGFRHALEMLKQQGVETNKVIVIGSSAGAHLGGLLVYHKEMQKKYEINQGIFKGYVSLGGPVALEYCHTKKIEPMLKALFPLEYDIKQADVYYKIEGDETFPVLCLHSLYDPVSPVENVEMFCNKVKAKTQRDDLVQCSLLDNEEMLHSNVIAGIFLEENSNSEPFLIFENWLEEKTREQS